MASDIWLRTIMIVRKETQCHHMGYVFLLAASDLLYALSRRQDRTYHGLCYTSCGALAGTRHSPMGPPCVIDPTPHRTMGERFTYELCSAPGSNNNNNNNNNNNLKNPLIYELHVRPLFLCNMSKL